MSKDTWHAFECFGPCSKVGSGLVLDVRVNEHLLPDPFPCPVCGCGMHEQSSWEADEDGYGSRGDGSEVGKAHTLKSLC